VRESAEQAGLPPEEENLAIFAGRVARQIGTLAASIEGTFA
jgi:hypothetical protein